MRDEGKADPSAEDHGEEGATLMPAQDAHDTDDDWLGLSPESCRRKRTDLARLEDLFRRFRARVLTPRSIAREVAARHTRWVRLEGSYAAFPSEPMAREAALCVREDGEALEDVAARARVALHQVRIVIEEVAPALQGPLLAASPGALLGPLDWDGEVRLLLVRDKVMPSSDDPDIWRRAEQIVWRRALEHEIASRVRWSDRP